MSLYLMSAYMITAHGAGLFWVFAAGAGNRNGFPQPPSYIVAAFFCGMLLTLPAFAAERAILEITLHQSRLLEAVSGPAEEACKFAATRLAAARFAPREGSARHTAAAVSASMGFAAVENVAYMAQYGPAAIPARTIISPLLHTSWALLWGRALDRDRPAAYGTGSLIFAAALHSAYNLALDVTGLAAIPAALIAAWVIWGRASKAPRPAQQENDCVYCRGQAANITGICPACGKPVREDPCQGCGEKLSPEAVFCHGCGLRQEN